MEGGLRLHCLAWPNVDPLMLDGHKWVMGLWGLDVEYTIEQRPHGEWMDDVCKSSKDNVVGFIEIDALPTDGGLVKAAYDWVAGNEGILGIAQSANHLLPNHIYAGPAFYFIHKRAWEKVDCSFSETQDTDVAQLVSIYGERLGIPIRCLYPSHYLFPPEGERWRLGNYGKFGRGTFYRPGLFHLFQGRLNNSVNVFADISEKIVNGEFTTKGWHECERL